MCKYARRDETKKNLNAEFLVYVGWHWDAEKQDDGMFEVGGNREEVERSDTHNKIKSYNLKFYNNFISYKQGICESCCGNKRQWSQRGVADGVKEQKDH